MPRSMKVKPPVEKVIFTTGTPLGSLSSWGVFTLLHHLLIQQAAYLCSRKCQWFSNYAILGDDLVIGSPEVARQYRRLLKWMGVGISLEKSLASVNGSMEFASRFIYRGTDLSPISFKGLGTIVIFPALVLLPARCGISTDSLVGICPRFRCRFQSTGTVWGIVPHSPDPTK